MIQLEEIKSIRSKLEATGSWSHTTATFQNQILSFVGLNAAAGDFVIEVGCFRGGLTAQLAYATRVLNKELYVIDIDPDMLQSATTSVKVALGSVPPSTHFYRGDLRTFLAERLPPGRCILLFIDGDHRYPGVVSDIRAVLKSGLVKPLSLAFHDFSLRYAPEAALDVRVDDAIRDELAGCVVHPIGELSGLGGLRCESSPGADGHYHKLGSTEGVMITIH